VTCIAHIVGFASHRFMQVQSWSTIIYQKPPLLLDKDDDFEVLSSISSTSSRRGSPSSMMQSLMKFLENRIRLALGYKIINARV
jgi:hypothetical protein